jgi:replication factor C small subunit
MENSTEPQTLEDIAGQTAFVSDAMGWRDSGSWPRAVLLHGMQGTGKSTAAKVMLREKMGDFFDPMNYIIVNASDDRGLDYIRNQLKQMSAVKAVGTDRRGIIVDEADGLTPAAQDALRGIMEEYAENVFYIFTCNEISKIKPAIQSRCLVYEFKPISPEDGAKRLVALFKPHLIEMDLQSAWSNTFMRLMKFTGGDMRSAIAIMESHGDAPLDALQKRLSDGGNPSQAALAAIGGEYGDMRKQFYSMLDRGLSLTFVMRTFHENLTEFFEMDEDNTWTVMGVLGEMIPHMYEWPIGSHSFVDCLVARLRKEVLS